MSAFLYLAEWSLQGHVDDESKRNGHCGGGLDA